MADLPAKIRHVRDVLGFSRRALGELMDVPEGKIQKIETGDQRADHVFLSNFGKVTEADINWLLDETSPIEDKNYLTAYMRGKFANGSTPRHDPMPDDTEKGSEAIQDEDYVAIPRYDVSVSAGHGSQDVSETVVAHYAFSKGWLSRRNLNPDNLAVVRVRGDSMEPKLSNGDLALIDRKQTEMHDGVTYVFRLGDDLLIKRLQIMPMRQVKLCSLNTEYDPITVELASDEFANIGRVVASMHEW